MDSNNNHKPKRNKWLICPDCEEHIPRIKDIILYHSSLKLYIKYRCRCPLVTEKTIELSTFISKIKAIDLDNKPFCFNLSHPSRQSTNYCPLCNSWFCFDCSNEHKLNYPSHILSKKKFNLSYECYMHNNKEISQRCVTCNLNGCETCIKNEHSKHKTISYANYWEETRDNHQFKSLLQFIEYANHFIMKNEDYQKKWFEKNKSLPEVVIQEINKSFKLNYDINHVLIKLSKILISNFYAMKSKQNFTVVNNIVNYLKYNLSNTDLNQRGTSRNLINHYKNCFIHHLTIYYKCSWTNLNSNNRKVRELIKLENGNVLSYSDDNSIKICDVYSLNCIEIISCNEDRILKVIELKSNIVISVFKDNVVKIWELNNQSQVSSMMISIKIDYSIIEVLKLNLDQVCIMTEKEIQIFKLNNKELILDSKIQRENYIFKSMMDLNDPEYILTISSTNEICKWKIDNYNHIDKFNEIKSIFHYNCKNTINIITELSNESIAMTVDNNIIILQSNLQKEVRRMKVSTGVISCVTQLDDERLVLGSHGSIILWNCIEGESYIEVYNDTSSKVIQIKELEDLRLATIWNTHIIKLWNMASLKCITIIEAHKSAINCLIYLSDGKLMTASDDCSIKIWN